MVQSTVDDIREQVRYLIETCSARIAEIDSKLAEAEELKTERIRLVDQMARLETSLVPERKTTQQTAVAAGAYLPDRFKTAAVTKTAIAEILQSRYPKEMHWEGIYAELRNRGIGLEWSAPYQVIKRACRSNPDAKQTGRGTWAYEAKAREEGE